MLYGLHRDIQADQDHLHEAFQNVLRNAVEATQSFTPSPQIQIETAFDDDLQN